MKIEDLPNVLPVFPLSNFIIFPRTTVPLNIFEPRYIQMVDKSMKSDRMIGMIQPKKTGELKKPDLHSVGCAGKITSFNETDDGRYLIILNLQIPFKIIRYRPSSVSLKLVIFPAQPTLCRSGFFSSPVFLG